MFALGFWVSTLPKDGFIAACDELAGMGVTKVLAFSEEYDREAIAQLTDACHSRGMELHAWSMNNMVSFRGVPREFIEAHRSWLAVNRNGQTGLEFPLWGRQIWWCPGNREHLDYYIDRWNGLLTDTGADGLHLDFIRYPDIWDYQDGRAIERAEVPEYSFCYCHECRDRFREETGTDPVDVPLDARDALYQEWRRWRMDVIVKTVLAVRAGIDRRLKLSAAVFPTPGISRTVVLQDWPAFADRLDFVCTMIYAQKQWGRPISWVKEATEEGCREMSARSAYYSGFGYPIRDQTTSDLRAGLLAARDGGAEGAVIFNYPGPNERQRTVIAEAFREIAR